MNNYKLVVLLGTMLVIVGCQSVPMSNEENSVSKKVISIPALGSIQKVNNGESLYFQMEYLGSIVYKPTEAKTITAPRAFNVANYNVTLTTSNVFIKGKTEKGENIICSVEKIAKNTWEALSVCISDSTTGKLNKLIVNQSDMYTKDVQLDPIPQFSESEIIFNPSGPTKKELIFQGFESNTLAFQYKEFNDTKLTLNQPLFIPIDAFPVILDIKQATFILKKYLNGELHYEVTKNMPESIRGNEKVQCLTPGYNYMGTYTVDYCSKEKMVVFPLGSYAN